MFFSFSEKDGAVAVGRGLLRFRPALPSTVSWITGNLPVAAAGVPELVRGSVLRHRIHPLERHPAACFPHGGAASPAGS